MGNSKLPPRVGNPYARPSSVVNEHKKTKVKVDYWLALVTAGCSLAYIALTIILVLSLSLDRVVGRRFLINMPVLIGVTASVFRASLRVSPLRDHFGRYLEWSHFRHAGVIGWDSVTVIGITEAIDFPRLAVATLAW